MTVTRFVLSAQLCHIPGQQVPQINEELPQCTCPCQPTLTTFRACTLSSWFLCVFPGNRLYLQPELLYLLQHRGLVVPATTEKTVTDVALPCMHSFKAPNIEIPLSKRQKISITTRLQQQIP